MSRFIPNVNAGTLRDKVVVLTGGSNGIGAATVERLCGLGAKIVFGDVQSEAGERQVKILSSSNVRFVKTDVTSYQDLIVLFDTALKAFGRIDYAISNAGIAEIGNWFDPELNLESIKQVPEKRTLDVNLLGTLYFARIASVYLRQGQTKDDDRSLVLLSSVAGILESPGMPVYQASKHGVMGVMRSLRLTLPKFANIRVNAICPWFVETAMTVKLADTWQKYNLPVNKPAGVAEIILGVASNKGINGKAVYIEGDRGWEIEENIDRLAPQWMGEQQTKDFQLGNQIMETGECWQTDISPNLGHLKSN